ncbi:metallophosphoesterase [Tardiphaga sp. OK245]|uniref:metallophosphoesterase n=1 Tax=Tardiphaga sp. OK245 TaxID=1855306 RepID=UPI0008A75ED7|nr:metallophosphoesterase [Tardiphaga sp. OK245]SEH87634.1 Calcineurin-like phosphoesterase superfamily domain-containing protein [Tardiphaga sp. OK245]
MKIQIFSDAHIDYPGSRGLPPLIPGVQAVLVAGDVCEGLIRSLTELREAYPKPVEIVVVAGNHEFYRSVWPDEVRNGQGAAAVLGVHFLEDEAIAIGKLRIIGATLWTDYELFGPVLREPAMRTAYNTMSDHKRITWQKSPWLRFRPHEARMLHQSSRAFIQAQLATAHNGPTLVLSHHACCIEAIDPNFREDMISAAYASDLRELVDDYQPEFWVSGHTHYSMDLQRGRTRLISNPIGYAHNNQHFDPLFTVEIDA